ncbi:T9SS type A sorting domain-containing protein [bacterium]|nr:T9SS type A sorting domain-containing protein [bacterium]
MNKRQFILAVCALLAVHRAGLCQQWDHYTPANSGLPSSRVNAVCVDESGMKWIGTENGLCRFDGSLWTVFNTGTHPGLADNAIRDLALETLESGYALWIATGNGVSRAVVFQDAIQFTDLYRAANSGLVADRVNNALVDVYQVKWFGTDQGVSSFTGQAWVTYTKENFWLAHNRVKSSATREADGMNYFGSEGAGVSRLRMDPVDGITYASPLDWAWSGIASDSVYSILIEENGNQWFGTDHGVCLHTSDDTRRDWTTFSTQDGLAHNLVQAICRDKAGVMWFGTHAGLSRYDGHTWRNYTTADGLPGNDILDLAADADGSLWIACQGGFTRHTPASHAQKNTAGIPDRFEIAVFPNPFNQGTVVRFTLRNFCFCRLSVHDLSGREIQTLADRHFAAGSHAISWDGRAGGRELPSGIYAAVLRTDKRRASQKMILVR